MNGRNTHPAWQRLALSLLGAVALAGALRADYLGSFQTGIRALDFRDWPQLVAAMRQAIAQQPRATGEGVRIYGMRRMPYIPHYFLGLGLYRQGDYAGAAAALAEATAQGTVHGIFRARMELFQEVCARRLGLPRQAPLPARPQVASGGSSAPPGQAPASPPGSSPTVRTSPSLQPQPPIVVLGPGPVRQKAIEEAVQTGRRWLSQGETLVQSLAERRRRDPRSFGRDPAQADVIAVAERRLQSASFQLEGCWREGDLEGAEHARDDAHAAWEMLDELARDL